MLEKSKWIWLEKQAEKDEYASFKCAFNRSSAKLTIAAESDYAAYVNGKLAAFGAYKAYSSVKYADEITLDNYLKSGENLLEIIVWYEGVNTQCSIDDGAGVIFELSSNNEIIAVSDENTLSREYTRYKKGYKKVITGQLGYSFLYDETVDLTNFAKSRVLTDKTRNILPRPIKKLNVGAPANSTLIKQENNVYLFDLGKETAGQLYLDVCTDKTQKLLITYGEHIQFGGQVLRKVGKRDFSVEYVAKKGENVYINPFRRLGLRYLEVHAEEPLKINAATVLPVEYPLTRSEIVADTPLHKRISEVAADTLSLCMHEHYEDCPWREQGLYTFDSRNEMLCAYYAFKDSEKFTRSNLVLISKGVRSDGFLELTYPSVNTPAIPLYSLAFAVQVAEYVKFTGDRTVLDEVGGVVKKIMQNFREIADNGLIADFAYPYWNFYEWTEGSDNAGELSRSAADKYVKRYALNLNAYYVYAEEKYASIYPEDKKDTSAFVSLITREFYDEKAEMFRAYVGENFYTEFGNGLAMLIGACPQDKKIKLADKLMGGAAVPATLASAAYLYDALLPLGKKYEDYVISVLDRDYKSMLDAGATSFWETIEGAGSFDSAGSLCHGWSALPIYYYAVTGRVKFKK